MPGEFAGEFLYSANAYDVDSGECGAEGDNLTWTLDAEGTLTIGGEGAMVDWNYDNISPWSDYCEDIKQVIISDGVKCIGAAAFFSSL